MLFSQILAARSRQENIITFTTTDDWAQGRTMFGGFLSALAVQAMRDLAGSDWPLRALQTNFIGPVAVGEVQIKVELLRQGKNIRQVKATVLSNHEVAGLMLGVFGAARESELPVFMPAQPASQRSFDDAAVLPFFPGIAPNFLKNLGMRWAEGAFPYTNSPSRSSKIYVQLKGDTIDAELATVMLTDAPPTPMISGFDRPVPASSVSWSLELRVPADVTTSEGWWRIDMTTQGASEGYTNEQSALWTPDGRLAALGYQVVAVYG